MAYKKTVVTVVDLVRRPARESPEGGPIVPFQFGVLPKSSQPTESPSAALYPLLGPFDESGMRMVLIGITELSSMGRTQWKMLTSAFVEQFYNHGEKGDGKRGIYMCSGHVVIFIFFQSIDSLLRFHAEQQMPFRT